MNPDRLTSITVPFRFRGPADSGNGGYTCGIVSGLVEGDAEVTLRAPPPLERPLRVERDGPTVTVYDATVPIAEGRPADWSLPIPDPPSYWEAVDASHRYAGHDRHAFPECFVCGTRRPDGLQIFAGSVPGRDIVAAPWTPDPTLPNTEGVVSPETVWAALDCPGAWAEERHIREGPVVLGRMAARLESSPRIGDRCISIGWPIRQEGRKLFAGTALFSERGELHGCARQTWIVLSGFG